METIVLSNQLTILNQYTFTNCSGLTSITIPNSVKKFEDTAFVNCENLSDIYFCGSEDEWRRIENVASIPDGIRIHYEHKIM